MFPKIARGIGQGTKVVLNQGHRLAKNLKAAYRCEPRFMQGNTVRDLCGNVDAFLEEDAPPTSSVRRIASKWPVSGMFEHNGAASLRVPATIWDVLGSNGPYTFCFWQMAHAYANLSSVWDTVSNHFAFTMGDGSTHCNKVRVWYNNFATASLTLPMTLLREQYNRIAVAIDGTGNVIIYVNGLQAVTGTHSTGIVAPFTNPISFGTALAGGTNRHDGGVGDLFLHKEYFDSATAMWDYQEAAIGFANLIPQHSVLGLAFSGINDTATASTPGTITLTAPTAEATADSTATGSSPGTITLTAPTAVAYQNTDATATGSSPGTITLTAPTATAFESSDGTATASSPGTITLTAPTASATATGGVSVDSPGTITLTAPTARARPDYVYTPAPSYRGRFLRGQILPITVTFTEMPTSAPSARFFRGASLVGSVAIPVVDTARRVFGLDHFLDESYDDGHYVIVYDYDVEGNAQYSIEYFDVLGGVGKPAVVAAVEQKRPLGRAVLYFDDEGVGRLGYSARVETP